MAEGLLPGVHWLGHASFRIEIRHKVLYIDPWELKVGAPKADVILITHDHHDHCSPEDVERLTKSDTFIVATASCLEKLGCDSAKSLTVEPGQRANVAGVGIRAVPAYTVDKRFHPAEAGGVGYLIELEEGLLYHSGDTDVIPEMDGLTMDVALLPIGGTYTMNVQEAVEAVRRLKPRVVVPMHYGRIVGELDDAHRFAELVEEAEVAILPEED